MLYIRFPLADIVAVPLSPSRITGLVYLLLNIVARYCQCERPLTFSCWSGKIGYICIPKSRCA